MGNADPIAWARDKRRKAERYADAPLVEIIRRARDVAMSGAPVAALIGPACNGGRNENTTGWKSCSERERAAALASGRKPIGGGDPRTGYGNVASKNLHELGPYGVEGGYVPDEVAGPGSPWATLAVTEAARKILGRDGVRGADWYDAIDDQIALGVLCLASHARRARKRLDARLQWAEDGDDGPKVWTLWPFALACMAWSAGDGGAAGHVNAYADALAALPEARRWGAFMRFAALDDSPKAKHKQDEYSALRTAQKLESARLAVQFTGEGDAALAWLSDGLEPDERAAIYARLVATT